MEEIKKELKDLKFLMRDIIDKLNDIMLELKDLGCQVGKNTDNIKELESRLDDIDLHWANCSVDDVLDRLDEIENNLKRRMGNA